MPEHRIGEELVWVTDIQPTQTGEFRNSLSEGRQFLAKQYRMTANELVIAEGLIDANPAADWYVPLWFEESLGGTISPTDTTITCDTDGSYKAGGRAVIYQDRETFSVVEIDAVNAGSLGLTAAVGAAYTNPVIAPVVTGFAPAGLEFERRYHNDVVSSMRWWVRGRDETAASPFAQFNGLDVVSDISLAIQPISGGVRHEVEILDNGFGTIDITAIRDISEKAYGMNFQDEGLAAKKRRREWLNIVRGRDQAFYMATRSREILAASPIGATDNVISVKPALPNITDYIGRVISIGGSIYRTIADAVVNGANHDLTISPTSQAFTDPEICFLRKFRFDQDAIEIEHEGIRSFGQIVLKEVPA